MRRRRKREGGLHLESEQLAGPLGDDGPGQAGAHYHQVILLLQTVHPTELLFAHLVTGESPDRCQVTGDR